MASSQKSQKRKHETLTLNQKMEILRQVDNGISFTDIAKLFNVGRSTIYDIRKNRNKLENYVGGLNLGRRQTMRTGEYSVLEQELFLWFTQERTHTPITADILRQKALQLYEEIYKTNEFKASDGWFTKFKARFGISIPTIPDQKTSNEAAASSFVDFFKLKIAELGLSAEQVYTANESGLVWKLLPQETYAHREKTTGRKVPKERITFMLCSNATGTHKLKLLLVGKAKNPRTFKNLCLPFVHKNQSRAWVTEDIFRDWFHNDYVPEVKRFLHSINLPQKALLVLDNAPAHNPDNVLLLEDGSIKTIFIPCNCTPLLQPMGQNLMETIKANYKKKILIHAVTREGDIAQSMKEMSLKDAVVNICEIWDRIPENIIKSSWEKLWPSVNRNATDWESEDLMPLGELIQMTSSENPDFTQDSIKQWFVEDPEILEPLLTNEDLTAADVSDEEDDSEYVETSSIKSDDALKGIDITIKWAEENGKSSNTMTNLRRLREDIMLKIYKEKKT